MAWTATDRDALKAAIANGEKAVGFADRTVTYRDVDEMLRALQAIEAELAATDPAAPKRPRQYHIVTSKGL